MLRESRCSVADGRRSLGIFQDEMTSFREKLFIPLSHYVAAAAEVRKHKEQSVITNNHHHHASMFTVVHICGRTALQLVCFYYN